MAVSYPLTLPDDDFRAAMFGADFNNRQNRSLVGEITVDAQDGDLLLFEFQLPPKVREYASAWTAFGMNLRGTYGCFYGYDPTARTSRGTISGTLRVNGADQSGYELAVDGASGTMKAGDWIEVNGLLRMVVADISLPGTLEISPGIPSDLAPADNETITYTNPKGKFRLSSNSVSWDIDLLTHYGISFQAIEVLDT